MSQLVPSTYSQIWEYLPDFQKTANLFITFTPLFSYGTTCYSIYSKQTSMGFSIDICATMLIASILRILYYVIVPYEISLLRQSIVMIFIQCALLKTSLYYRPKNYNVEYLQPFPVFKNELNSQLPRRLSAASNLTDHESYNGRGVLSIGKMLGDLLQVTNSYVVTIFNQFLRFFDVYYKRPGLFWQWSDETLYWKFLIYFSAFFSFLTFIFSNNQTYGTIIGLLGLFIESLLPLPQILLLKRLRSTRNFKVMLLLSWLGGDLTKLSYLVYGARNVSAIFISAGLFQMALDIIIAFQYFQYKDFQEQERAVSQGIELSDLV